LKVKKSGFQQFFGHSAEACNFSLEDFLQFCFFEKIFLQKFIRLGVSKKIEGFFGGGGGDFKPTFPALALSLPRYMFCSRKKIISRTWKISGTLIVNIMWPLKILS
jgi:hypothetical protein